MALQLLPALPLTRAAALLNTHVQVAWVPGSFELPVVAKAMAKSGKYDAVVCIGVVVSLFSCCTELLGCGAGTVHRNTATPLHSPMRASCSAPCGPHG